jgi:hypothetical protein
MFYRDQVDTLTTKVECKSNPADEGKKFYLVTVGDIRTVSFWIVAESEADAVAQVTQNF